MDKVSQQQPPLAEQYWCREVKTRCRSPPCHWDDGGSPRQPWKLQLPRLPFSISDWCRRWGALTDV